VKVAVIGGAGVRTPLLVQALARSGLPIDEIALFDTDAARLAAIADIARTFSPHVRTCDEAAATIRGATFVFLRIRVGGIEARARDEAIAIQHGIVGQETLGPAGFAMAVRTIPHALAYARLVAREAPDAWIVNSTNPLGIVTQAMSTQSDARVVGVCDTPGLLFQDVAAALGLDPSRCLFDYFGLNRLGWLREVYCDGRRRLAGIWRDPARLKQVYRAPLFGSVFLKELQLLPTEYLFYYYNPWEAFENVRKAGRTRGDAVARLNQQLFETITASPVDRVRAYEAYLEARHASHMAVETGVTGMDGASDADDLRARTRSRHRGSGDGSPNGTCTIAVAVARAIHFNTHAIMPLNVPNRGLLPDLQHDDVVEVPSVVNANGATPLHVEPIPASPRDLIARVKEYERLTIDATVLQSMDAAERALAANPLVGHPDLARELIADLGPLW
jgi:6-phospho-beta-glucosidase